MKVLGAVLVLSASTLVGFVYSLLLRKRRRILGDLVQAFQWLEAEIGYASYPLAEVARRISGRVPAETKQVFTFFLAELGGAAGLTAEEAWMNGLAHAREVLPLLGEDWALLENFGRTLGATDRTRQLQAIGQTIENLKLQAEAAEESLKKNERLYRYLGIAAGTLIVLIFY